MRIGHKCCAENSTQVTSQVVKLRRSLRSNEVDKLFRQLAQASESEIGEARDFAQESLRENVIASCRDFAIDRNESAGWLW